MHLRTGFYMTVVGQIKRAPTAHGSMSMTNSGYMIIWSLEPAITFSKPS